MDVCIHTHLLLHHVGLICFLRFEDFAECFPLYVEEERNGSSAIFNTISEHIERQNSVCRHVKIRCND